MQISFSAIDQLNDECLNNFFNTLALFWSYLQFIYYSFNFIMKQNGCTLSVELVLIQFLFGIIPSTAHT
jgi:hypothetical protein